MYIVNKHECIGFILLRFEEKSHHLIPLAPVVQKNYCYRGGTPPNACNSRLPFFLCTFITPHRKTPRLGAPTIQQSHHLNSRALNPFVRRCVFSQRLPRFAKQTPNYVPRMQLHSRRPIWVMITFTR